MTPNQILLKYWGYSDFRPLQEEIIQSVLEGKDTLALLPTGGGKSVCYQVPAMLREGLCLVVSPLIALMKDQVDNLRKRGIPSAAICSGMHYDEIDLVLGNARNGAYKLLYCSPERLTTQKMRESLLKMKVNLVAVDEAHCISQWGYDFRPPYLQIAGIRTLLPPVPFLALTATATPPVVADIIKKLEFRKENVFRKTFERKNLTYMVIKEEDKMGRLMRILSRVKGSGIIYVRNRRETRETADFLVRNSISAGFYHAGMDQKERDRKQKSWLNEEIRIIVATNAFGMGIDKPNVRVVVHLDLPDSIEAYFQEAGRAGRDEKPAFAILLYEKADLIQARNNLSMNFPGVETIRTVYQALGNFLQLPVGSGKDVSFDLEISALAEQYRISPVIAFNALKFLEKEGYLLLTDALLNPSRLFIKAGKEELYKLQVKNPVFDRLLKTILRCYSGVFTGFTRISENELARRMEMKSAEVGELLKRLDKLQIIDYLPQTNKPQLIFLEPRADPRDVMISVENYHNRFLEAEKRMEAMIRYAESDTKCRSQQLLAYFDEKQTKRCGRCDVCLERNRIRLNEIEFDGIVEVIKPLLKENACSMEEIVEAVKRFPEEKVIRVLQWLNDNEKLEYREGKFTWRK